MKTRSAPFTPSKGVDKAPNGVLMNVLFLNICPPEKDQNGNPKIVKDGAPPKFMVLPLESADVMCYQGKGQSAKAKLQMQYFSPEPIRFEAFARTRKLKSFALPRNPVPGGMYKIDTLSYSRFKDQAPENAEKDPSTSFNAARVVPNYSDTLESFLAKAPFEVYSLDDASVRTQSGYNCNPDPFAPAKPFVTTLIPMRESIQARLAVQLPGTSFARFVEHEHDRACASITGISTGTHPGITFGNPPRDPNAPPAKAGDAEVKKDAQIMVYNKKPDGEMFVVLLYTRFFRESIAGLQLTADQWYALSGKFVPDLCGLMLGTVQAKPTDECTPTIEFEYCDGVCKAGVTLNPDLAKMIPAIGVPCSLAVAKRVYESKKVAPAMMTERFNLTFARAINILTCDAREAKLCLDFPGMQFFFISNFTDLTSKQIELATKLSDDEFFTIFMETGRNKDESLLLGYKNLAEGVENTRDAPRIPAAAAVFAMLPEGHPGRSGPLLNTIDPNMVRALAQMQPKAPAPVTQVQDAPPAQEEIPAPVVHEAPAPPVSAKPAKKAKTSGSA